MICRYGKMFVCMLLFTGAAMFMASSCTSAQSAFRAMANSSSGGTYKIGNPYEIDGKWYYPREDYFYNEVGLASWYGEDFHNGITANGERYDMHAMTAAHKTLPLPSIVKVTNLENGRSVILRVNDRGPFYANRIIDVSKYASEKLGFHAKGTARVRVEIMAKESKELKQAMLDKEAWAKNAYKKSSGSVGSSGYGYGATTGVAATGAGVQRYRSPIKSITKVPQKNAINNNQAAIKQYPVKNDTAIKAKTTAEAKVDLYVEERVDIAPLPEVSEGSLFVQAGAFSVKENADKFAAEIKKIGNVTVTEANSQSGTVYRVRLGPFDSGKKAEEILNKVNSLGHSGRIIDVSN